ncbi:MAG: cation:proton antiporter [Pseudomonadales bacterium]|jgi:glutathione-regulated potassium-efflux system protein KefB|nr:cation:proton antiporter [Pseudomonadales bacterium]MBP7910845.1 cation:proton antiporter [Pseudomonadales bacterium]
MHSDFLLQTLVLLGAIVIVVPLLTRLGLGSVPGYLVAGLIVGPPLLCAVAIAAPLWWGGMALPAATVTALALALSSTAIVVQLLSERGELSSQRGRATFAVLLLQDVAVAPLLMLVYLLGTGGGETAISTAGLLEALATLAAVLLLGRLVWRRVLPFLAAQRNVDILVAVALLLVLSAAWLMEHAGMSLAMGAFLAGVLLADSPFRRFATRWSPTSSRFAASCSGCSS